MAREWNKSYATNEFNSSYGLFYNRELYKTQTYPEQAYDVQPIDLWYVSSDYGKVDSFGNALAVNPDYVKQIKSSNNENLFALNFVADAFGDLRDYMIQAGFQNKIATTETEYYDLQPHRGWVPLDAEFDKFMKISYDAFAKGFMNNQTINQKVTDFTSFLRVFASFIERITPKFLFTKTSFVMSRYGTPLSCGLMLDLSIDKNGDDPTKYDKFIQDKNFTFFTKAAKRFGFLLDKNAPWRLVADLGSPEIQKYMRRYNLTLDNIFLMAYTPTYKTDIEVMKTSLMSFYNLYAAMRPEVRIMKTAKDRTNALSTTMYKRVMISEASVAAIDERFWLRYYLFIRGKEMGRPWRQTTFDRLFNTASQVYKFQNYNKAIAYLNRRLRGKEFRFLPLTSQGSDDTIVFDFLNPSSKETFRLL